MKKHIRWIPAVVATALLAGCSLPSFNSNSEVATTDSSTKSSGSTIIPSMQIDDQYYRTLLPYKESVTRGLIVSNIYSRYDIQEAETGLMRLSLNQFDSEKYYFQEGQYLDKDTVRSWLARSNDDKAGLNPSNKGMKPAEAATKAPIYLAHIIEQNYLTKSDDKKVKLGGVSIGLALNSVYYYQKEQYGATFEQAIDDKVLEEQGKKIAAQIVKRMRKMDGLGNVPITVGLYKQLSHKDIVPGTYFASATAKSGSASLSDWEDINEQYVRFPTESTDAMYSETNDNFKTFKDDIDEYFANGTNVIGRGYYKDGKIQRLTVEIPIKFNGTGEMIGFTQYVASAVTSQFKKDLQVEVNITSSHGAEALVVKEAGTSEPYVHIYND
ncbi:CamS family sex pheromone protein [Kurthia massiliensis]|uniref:CamS family sex pheromone protein n=1 Tax=Kurthia massiliensis TaxID=1033739 RepID=UPI0002887950|nr:CamS family sex pheromone protein [Kurthia massiliensis]